MSSKKQQSITWLCSECGTDAASWSGRCTTCGAWNTLKEYRSPVAKPAGSMANEIEVVDLTSAEPLVLPNRLATDLGEVDRVLGGGFFPGSVTLLAGEPGIGKSTLLLTIAQTLAQSNPVIYVSGEESADQIRHRADRLHLLPSGVKLLITTNLSETLDWLAKNPSTFVVVDSIQALVDPDLPSAAGSVVQVRETAASLARWAKTSGNTLLLVGHVTKEGTVAGPRTLEHLVDVFLSLEGERTSDLRLLRSFKNRYGSTDEVGILAMTAEGLVPVDNPSKRFLGHRSQPVPGSAVTVVLEGVRPLLVEIQALTRPMAGPYPRRMASGFDSSRLELLVAVLEAWGNLSLAKKDCYLNISGGLRLKEPAADLAVVLAIASAATGRPLPENLVVFGEVGLAGEIRPVTMAKRRFEEAKRLGFSDRITTATLADALQALKLA